MDNLSSPGQGSPQMSPKGSRSKSDKQITKRAVSIQKRIFIVFAVLVALLLVLALTATKPTTYVLRAKSNVPALTALTNDQIEIVAIDSSSIEDGSLSNANKEKLVELFTSTVLNKKNKFELFKNQQLHDSFFASSIAEDEQLISIPAKSGDAVVGKIIAGDRVDIWAGLSSGGAINLVATNIEVYAVSLSQEQLDSVSNALVSNPSGKVNTLLPNTPMPGSYVLKVKTIDLPKYLAISNGTSSGGRVFLTLRSPDALDTPSINPIDAHAVLCGARADNICARK
jgi:hypothetical protein